MLPVSVNTSLWATTHKTKSSQCSIKIHREVRRLDHNHIGLIGVEAGVAGFKSLQSVATGPSEETVFLAWFCGVIGPGDQFAQIYSVTNSTYLADDQLALSPSTW